MKKQNNAFRNTGGRSQSEVPPTGEGIKGETMSNKISGGRIAKTMTSIKKITGALKTFFPTETCAGGCKLKWSTGEECAHNIRPSPDCSNRCRERLRKQQFCVHAEISCGHCGETQWPVKDCYCYPIENTLYDR